VTLAIVVGVLTGIVAGLLGVGGGILFVPALVILLDQTQLAAEATSLVAMIPVAIVGAWRQYRYGNVRLADAGVLATVAPLAAVLGVVLANALSDRALSIGFGILLLVVAAQLARKSLRREAPPVAEEASVAGRA
jgi:uncharacterized membrane protein YfcA